MSPKSIMELTKVVASRYLKAISRKEKTKILDEYCSNTGLNRKYAISKIRNFLFKNKKEKKKRGRKNSYSSLTDDILIKIWKIFDCICAERLHPYLGEAIRVLKKLGYLSIKPETEVELLRMSLSSVKRRITKHRNLKQRTLISTTKPGYLLKKEIPIQTISWDQNKPGFCEIDLVAHCGGSLIGDFIYTLQFVDLKTTWTERKAVMGKSQSRVFKGIKKVKKQLPFPLLGIDSDNGSEFINWHLFNYCKEEKILFTRSRPYMKKDNAHIEQKNWTTVRKVLGYDRFDTEEHLRLINDLYDNELRLFINFFQPTMKLKKKTRIGSKYKREYDQAKTPYQRVLESKEISQEEKDKLISVYEKLDPVKLKKSINRKINKIISLKKKTGKSQENM